MTVENPTKVLQSKSLLYMKNVRVICKAREPLRNTEAKSLRRVEATDKEVEGEMAIERGKGRKKVK